MHSLRNWLVFLALVLCHTANSAELFGTVDALSGSSSIVDQSGKAAATSVGSKIFEGQTINTGQDGEVHVVTEDGGIIAVRPNTVFRVDEYKAEGNSTDKIFMSLLKGTVRSITGWVGKYDHSAYRITTPTATIGVRGTDHETTVIEAGNGDDPGTYDTVNEGSTVMKTPHGSSEVAVGKFAFAPKGKAVAPFLLAQRPRFFANRSLRIENRIQLRKASLHGRLDQMREERIKNPKLIQGSRRKQGDLQRASVRDQEHMPMAERRSELRERRPELTAPRQQTRRMSMEGGREMNRGEFRARARQRQEITERNREGGEENNRIAERKGRARMRRN